jgi:AraC-like DNA-binding protein
MEPKSNRRLVKSAALDAGLTHLGRFSAEYRELFGESPTMTLNRYSS